MVFESIVVHYHNDHDGYCYVNQLLSEDFDDVTVDADVVVHAVDAAAVAAAAAAALTTGDVDADDDDDDDDVDVDDADDDYDDDDWSLGGKSSPELPQTGNRRSRNL